MNFNSRITLAISRFFRKHGRVILIVFIVWLIIFIINQYLKTQPKHEASIKSYNPDRAVMEENGNVPSQYRDTIKDVINEYFNYCKKKEYEKAFNLLTSDCKEFVYENNVARFTEYIGNKYVNKTYYIQNYSNLKDAYIYDFFVIDDIEATGGTSGYSEQREKLTLIKENDNFKISNQGYIGRQDYNIVAEDENMKIKITSKDITYQKEAYNFEITNKTSKYVLISDGTYTDAVTLNLGDQKRHATNTPNATFLVSPNSTKNFTFIFDKYADDHNTPTEINLNDVCIFDEYLTTQTPSDAQKLYSFNISLK